MFTAEKEAVISQGPKSKKMGKKQCVFSVFQLFSYKNRRSCGKGKVKRLP